MPQFAISVPHSLTKDEAHERLKSFSAKVKEHYAEMVKDIDQSWDGDTLNFGFKTLGANIDGSLAIGDNAVDVQGSLPMTAMLFKGKIESVLRDEIAKLLG